MIKGTKKAPEGVKILAFAFFAGALVSMVFAGFMFSFADTLRMDPSLMAVGAAGLSPWMIVLAGIFFVGFAVLDYYLGKGLLKAQNWARVVVGVFVILGIISALVNIGTTYVSGIFSLVLNGLIGWYLFVKKDTKKFFK